MAKRIGIIGAGTAGQQLGVELRRKPGLRACATAFFDENRSLWESYVSGIPVIGPPDKLLDPVLRWNLKLDEVLLALEDPAPRTLLALMRILRKTSLPARMLSDDFELIRKAEAAHLRAVELGDVFPDARWVAREEDSRRVIESRVILVAGAGIPVGKEICWRILRRYPRRLVALESSVDELAGLERELADLGQGAIVSSRVWGRMVAREPNTLVKELRPDAIFYLPDQRVRYGEQFVAEYFKRNVLPLVQFAEAAWKHGTKVCVMCGEESDPASMRGLMWRLAQMYLGSLHFGYPQKAAFNSLKWPLVVDLNEGVFAQWRRQIDCGGPITEPEGISILRCITKRDAAESAIECAGRGQAGRAYVMDGVEGIPVSDVMDRMRVVYGLPGFEVPREQKCPRQDGPSSSEVSLRENVLPSAGIQEIRQFIEFLAAKANVLSPDGFKNEVQRFVSATANARE